jgi:hypothetical protein
LKSRKPVLNPKEAGSPVGVFLTQGFVEGDSGGEDFCQVQDPDLSYLLILKNIFKKGEEERVGG